jgi:hypothetical protein
MRLRLLQIASLLALVLAGLGSSAARACSSCGCGDPTLTAMGQEKPYKYRVRLGFEERLGAHFEGEPSERNLVSRSAVAASFSPTGWLTLGALLPLVAVRSDSQLTPAATTVGLGDAEFVVRALVFRDRHFSPRHTLGLLLGLKAPTGPRVNDSTGYPAPGDVQPGSGSWDPLVGASYAHFGGLLSEFVSASYRHATTGYQGYRRGSLLGVSLAAQLAASRWSALLLGADISYATPSVLASGVVAPDTGGLLIAASPGLLFALRPDWLLRVVMQVPVAQIWRGQQFETTTLVLSLTVDLH